MSTYQPGIPTGTVNLDIDYDNIQKNFQQLDTSFGVDHVTFSNQTAQNGYHESIHLNPFSTTVTNPPDNYVKATASPAGLPTATPGFGQLFSCQVNDGLDTDESLYWQTGGDKLIPITRNLSPVAANNGYTCIPGGFIMEWGQKTVTRSPPATSPNTGATSVTFPIPFTNACFNVNAVTRYGSGSPPNSASSVSIGNITLTGFDYTVSGSQNFEGFYWTAIGN